MIRVLHVGLGPIGVAVARQLVTRRGFRSVGGIDIAPSKAGRDLGEVIGLDRRLRARVYADAETGLKATRPDVAILCTSSSLRVIRPQIEAILRAKVAVVSTTEELSYPVGRNRRLAREIDAAARRARVAVLGTGVNPGFVMDALPIALTAVCERVDGIEVDRIQDARTRRLPFQQKIGAGLTKAAFESKVQSGTVRHVGLTESISMIADALGWRLDRITDDIRPKIATAEVSSAFLRVQAGQVCGIVQQGVGYRDGRALIRLHMEAYLGAPESYDAVRVTGSPPLEMKIVGGVHGDVATASIVVNSIPKVLAAPPGLRTMRDLSLPSFYRG
jgi:4-hydroxy-tetrahydrodipicolinate reductase